MTEATTYSRTQIIDALVDEYEWYIHDTYDEEFDNNPDKFRESIVNMSDEELILQTCTDDTYTLEEFMHSYGY
ncbi:hypothetical protein N9026_00165 [bacterium]|nr:hypothetical protein [bacterium]